LTHSETRVRHAGPARALLPVARLFAVLFATGLALGCADGDDVGDAPDTGAAYASWAASPQDYAEAFPGGMPPAPQTFSDQTLRHVLRLSAGGDELRVHLSNRFGTSPLRIDAIAVAPSSGGPAIDAASSLALSFGGAPSVTIAPGEELWSDYAPFPLAAESDIAVSIFVGGSAPRATEHTLGRQTTYVAPGNAVDAATVPTDDMLSSYEWLTGVDVRGATARRVIVTFGDSITDGFASTVDGNHRYPNFLSARATAADAPGAFSVVNAGISGNRVLNDVVGPAGARRFAADVLAQTGVTDVIILLGINDIGFSGFAPDQEVSAEMITLGLTAMVASANAMNERVFLATLLPFEGVMAPYFSEAGEAKRQAVNDFIRASPTVAEIEVAGVIDFDAVMRDPNSPSTLRAEFDSGDHLHPNDAGYAAMADAIDLEKLE
jgi:lysophospholipase L1-like esterase